MPLISIIIPTHNRAIYAVPTIKSVLEISPLVEVIVSDTSEFDLISSAFVDQDRLKIIRPNRPMSVVDNFNEALKYASGKYVVFIGDDDLITNSIVEIAAWAYSKQIDAIKCTFPVSYYWPDYYSKYFKHGYAAKIAISKFDGSVNYLTPRSSYVNALNTIGSGVGGMPRAYLGMISITLIRKIEAKFGNLFGGVSPDIYSAALIANTAEKAAEIDYPFIIPGHSGASSSGQSAKGGHKGALRDNDHIRPFLDLVWDKRVPDFYSVPTVWGFSLLKASEKLNTPDFDLSPLYAKCLLHHPTYWRHTTASIGVNMREIGIMKAVGRLFCSFWFEFSLQLKRVGNRFFNSKAVKKSNIVLVDVIDTHYASSAIHHFLKDKKLNLE